uniref:Uncharacterized protein n=1 Tax=Cladonia uncialis subsp. uncialis TaxID=180999 RepID=A0A2K9YDE0_CLAUC|nr:hypothetical protein [Cladonia uncialis subsp. uncialis]
MGSVPSSTDPAASDDAGPPLACILHPTRHVGADSTTQLSFKARARNQILRLHRELIDERKRHERVVKELREQNKEDVVSLSSRVEYFEAQWSRLQRRMSELWLEVEGLKLPRHTHTPKSDAAAQTLDCSNANSSTQTRETSSSNAATQTRATQTRENAHSNLGAKDEHELKRWRRAFSHQSGTPEHIALGSRLTDKELSDWRTAFEPIPGTLVQKAASSKEAIDEVRKWRTCFNHVSGTPEQRAEASKSFLRKFTLEQCKNSKLLQSENALREQNQTLTREVKDSQHHKALQESEIRLLQERNLNLSTEIDRERSKREKLLRAVEEYQGTSNPQNETKRLTSTTGPSPSRRGSTINNHPASPTSVQVPKRKRDVSELDRQQDEPLPAPQRRRIGYSDPRWSPGERQGTIMAPWTAPQNRFGYPGFPVSSTMWSMPPTGAPMGFAWRTSSDIPTAAYPISGPYPASYPMGPSGVGEGPWRNSGYAETLPARSPSTASTTDSGCTNESMPKKALPAEKKWKHSMLKKAN